MSLASSPLRFWAPSAITALAIACATVSIQRSLAGDLTGAAWYVVWCTLLDKLDGMVARLAAAESAFGAELDSLADLVSFGVAPGVLVFSAARAHPPWGFAPGVWSVACGAAVTAYVLAASFRLARFNVTVLPRNAPRMFFGVPSTVVGGLVAALLLTLTKYGPAPAELAAPAAAAATGLPPPPPGPLGEDARGILVASLYLGAYLMVSRLRFPKVGRLRSRLATAALAVATVVAFAASILRVLPEYLLLYALASILIAIAYHLASPAARAVRRPRLFADRASGVEAVK